MTERFGGAMRAGLAVALAISLAGCAAGGGGSGWGAAAAAAVVVAGLVGCRGSAEGSARSSGPAAATGADGTETGEAAVAGTGAPETSEAVAGVTGTAETTDATDAPAMGEARVPGLDPAWDQEAGTGAGAVPASVEARPGASQTDQEWTRRPPEWRLRSAPPWKGERLEGRVRLKPRPAPLVPQVKP